MKRIGLLGGMSWESTAEYYRLVNEAVRERLGGLHSADCLVRSVDFVDVEGLQRAARWDEAGDLLAAEAQSLVTAGAELIVLCTNTMHKVAGAITDAIDVPFVHIADTTAAAVHEAGASMSALLHLTRGAYFFVGRLRERHGSRARARARGPLIVHEVTTRFCVAWWRRSRREYGASWPSWPTAEPGDPAGCTEIDARCAYDSPCRCSHHAAFTRQGGRAGKL